MVRRKNIKKECSAPQQPSLTTSSPTSSVGQDKNCCEHAFLNSKKNNPLKDHAAYRPKECSTKQRENKRARSEKKSLQKSDSKTDDVASGKTYDDRHSRLFENLLKVTHEYIKGKNYKPQSSSSLAEKLQIHPPHIAIFNHALHSLKSSGHIVEKEDGTVYPVQITQDEPYASQATIKNSIQGSISVHPRGFGFVSSAGFQEDTFIPKTHINGAIDGDIVEVEVDFENISDKGPHGRVVRIIERKRSSLAGTVTSLVDGYAYIFCTLLGEANLCKCPLKKNQKIRKGDRVLITVHKWGVKKQPEISEICQLLGNIEDPLTDIPFAIHAHGILAEFSQKATSEAISFGNQVKARDMKDRLDLRQLECFTIDPDTAKDFDDAVSLKKHDTGYLLGVHIADVSHYVQAGSALDREATLRCNSTYFPGKCIPMLPHELSDNLCSLKPNVNRLTVSVFINIDIQGKIVDWNIAKSVIKSQKRFTYRQAKEILDGKKSSKHMPTLLLLAELCQLLQKERGQRGSVQLSMPELILKIDEHGVPVGTEVHEYDITHQMIEECMLKANEVVATHIAQQGKSVAYRIHEEPSSESLQEFSSLVQTFGFSLPDTPTPHDIQQLFSEIEGNANAQYLATSYIKSMRLAIYSPDNIGHYGLRLHKYCHFTSPIRRYVDTVIHRTLFSITPLSHEDISQICLKASERERISARAEGSVLQIKKLRYLATTHATNPRKEYQALISKVKPFGIYFDIPCLAMDGFLHISELENDYFIFDEMKHILVGRHEKIVYRAGDSISVMCTSVDLVVEQALWQMIGRTIQHKISSKKENSTPGFDASISCIVQASSQEAAVEKTRKPKIRDSNSNIASDSFQAEPSLKKRRRKEKEVPLALQRLKRKKKEKLP